MEKEPFKFTFGLPPEEQAKYDQEVVQAAEEIDTSIIIIENIIASLSYKNKVS